MPIPVNRSCSTATAESTWWTPSPPAVPTALPTVSATADTSTAATDDPARMPIWQPDTGGCWCCHHLAAEHGRRWSGACILQHRSTNYAPAAAESKPSCRIATPSTCSAPMRWICRCGRPPLEPGTTKAAPLPSSSPNCGADALDSSRLGRRDDTCACLGDRWARHVSRSLPAPDLGSCRRDRRVRPVVSPLRMRGCAARQRDPAAGARTAGVAPDDVADHDPPLSLHRLWACVGPGHQPGRRAAGEAVASRAAMGHTRRGDKYVTVIIDLTPIRDGTGPARLLDMVEGRSKQVFKTWLGE